MANLAVTENWNSDQINIIKSQIAVGCTDAELALFGQVCQRTGLDPFTRQIYAISRQTWNPATKANESKMTIQLGIDGFRSIAAASDKYSGSQTYWCGADGHWVDVWLATEPPSAAKTEVYRGDSTTPFVAVARFSSYVQTTKDGTPNKIWGKMPDLMIGKVSEALALRKAFPQQLSGLYATEEMQQADNGILPVPTQDQLLIAEQKTANRAKFRALGWNGGQQKSWVLDRVSAPSSAWSLDTWIWINSELDMELSPDKAIDVDILEI